MSLSRLKFDDMEKVALRIHSSYSIGKYTPAEIAVSAQRQGLNVIAITDRATVDGIPETIIAGEKLGIYVIPGIEKMVRMDLRTVTMDIPPHLLIYKR